MSTKQANQRSFWEQAGQDGYGKAMFSNVPVEQHIRSTIWNSSIEVSRMLGLTRESKILELGSGDGTFTGTVLANNFTYIDGYDYSVSAIDKANALFGSESIRFHVKNVAELVYSPDQRWDGAFLMGFLHHVKKDASVIVSRLSKVVPNVVVADPNGNNLIRKTLELLPSYRSAGEDSFRLTQLEDFFGAAGYELVSQNIISFVPPFTPSFLLPTMIRLEKIVSSNPLLRRLNSTYVLGFKLRKGKNKD